MKKQGKFWKTVFDLSLKRPGIPRWITSLRLILFIIITAMYLVYPCATIVPLIVSNILKTEGYIPRSWITQNPYIDLGLTVVHYLLLWLMFVFSLRLAFEGIFLLYGLRRDLRLLRRWLEEPEEEV